MQSAIEYKDIMFVPCSREVLPLLGTGNIGLTDAANRGAPVDVLVRGLTDASITNQRAGLRDSSAPASVAQAKAAKDVEGNAIGGKFAVATVKSTDMIYFWVPRALFFVKRDELNFTRNTEMDEKSFASIYYTRVNFGAMLIDDDYALTVALRGTIKTAAA